MQTRKPVNVGRALYPPPMGWIQTFGVYGGAAILLFVGTHVLIPALSERTGQEPIVFWFLVGGLGVFAPLIIAGLLLLRQEPPLRGPQLWTRRLRFRPMDRGDWLWGIGALIVIGALSAGIQAILITLLNDVHLHPSFMDVEPLSQGRYWILAAWLPFWILNIFGEEFLWRGVMLPRQEVALGRQAWVANASGWLLFHVAFGWHLLLILLPILLILPYVVQRRQNTWIAVLIHAGLNGPGFVAVAFGLV